MRSRTLLKSIIALLVFSAFITCLLAVLAKTIYNPDPAELLEPTIPQGYEILNAQEVEVYRKDRFEQVSIELKRSELNPAHQDLLAHTLSSAYTGIPFESAYRVEQVLESSVSDPSEDSITFVVLADGRLSKINDILQPSYRGLKETPFSYPLVAPHVQWLMLFCPLTFGNFSWNWRSSERVVGVHQVDGNSIV